MLFYGHVGATRPAEAKILVDPDGSPLRWIGNK